MSKHQYFILALLLLGMCVISYAVGNWAQTLNPDGIQDVAATAASETGNDGLPNPATDVPRNAFSFGASIGLLATGLLYCLIAFGLLIRAKTKMQTAGVFTYCVAGMAVTAFVLSYVVDDYFY